MGSQPCCCKHSQDPIQEMKLKIEQKNSNHQIFVSDLQKPIPLEQILPLQEEDDFALFLVMEQYERLMIKYKRKSKSYSPNVDIQTISKETFTSYYFKSKNRQKPSKKTRSLTIVSLYTLYSYIGSQIYIIQNNQMNFQCIQQFKLTIQSYRCKSYLQFIGIRSILKKKEQINNQSSYFQQVSDVQKSIKTVHFDVTYSPKNSINRRTDVLKKKIFLKSYI